MITCALCVAVLSPMFLAPPAKPPENTGDLAIAHRRVAANMEYSRTELLDMVETLYGAERAAEIADITDPSNGTVMLGELVAPAQPGSHDATTIAIGTVHYPLWLCAIALNHEMIHVERAIAHGTSAYSQDPDTDVRIDPCGHCRHAEMYEDDLATIAGICDTPHLFLDGRFDLADSCHMACDVVQSVLLFLEACGAGGCPDIPTLDASSPPCCNCGGN